MTKDTKDPVAGVKALDAEIAGLQEQDRHRTPERLAHNARAHANFIDRMRSTMEDDSVQVLDAKIERLEHMTEGKYGKLLDGEQARYLDELEAARAEWARRFPPEQDAGEEDRAAFGIATQEEATAREIEAMCVPDDVGEEGRR